MKRFNVIITVGNNAYSVGVDSTRATRAITKALGELRMTDTASQRVISGIRVYEVIDNG